MKKQDDVKFPTIAPIQLEFQDFIISCPLEEGHRMVPVKTICEIIDVDFKTQDSWLKKHQFYAQLYRPAYTVGADSKKRKMNCLSIFDVDGWVNSISDNNRRDGSVDKQYAFLAWLREIKLGLYRSIEQIAAENQYERELLTKKGALLDEIEKQALDLKEKKKELAQVNKTLEEINVDKVTGQISLFNKKEND